MFEDNWFLFLLIVMAVFAGDGVFSDREVAVMMAILFALSMTNSSQCPSTTANALLNRT